MDEEQQVVRRRVELLLTTINKLDKARYEIRSLEKALARAKEFGVLMSKMGQNTTSGTKPVELANLRKEALEMDAQPEASTTPIKEMEREQEMLTLREELADQEALRE